MAISGLGQDLQGVSYILDQINYAWRSNSSALMMHPSASFGMWPNVRNNLDSLRTSLQGLKKEVEPILNSGRKRTFFKVHAKAWKLGLHVTAITTYRGCLDAHLKALKVSANMWVSSSSIG